MQLDFTAGGSCNIMLEREVNCMQIKDVEKLTGLPAKTIGIMKTRI